MARRGRPVTKNAKRNVIGIRMEDHEVSKLDEVCSKTRLSRTDLIRAGINMFYEKNGK